MSTCLLSLVSVILACCMFTGRSVLCIHYRCSHCCSIVPSITCTHVQHSAQSGHVRHICYTLFRDCRMLLHWLSTHTDVLFSALFCVRRLFSNLLSIRQPSVSANIHAAYRPILCPSAEQIPYYPKSGNNMSVRCAAFVL